jgi:protein-S-isoprenylcysteine O-methyltransferase Ste14
MGKDLFFASLIVCVITHVVRLVYEILKDKQILKPGKLSFVIMFTNMMLLWISWFLLCSQDISRINFPLIVRYLGLALSGIGIILFFTALFTIKTLESYNGDLIISGIYSIIRHPMYLGFVFWLIGFPVYFGGPVSMVIGLVFIVNILYWKYLEEKELMVRFPEYSEYRKTTIF